MSVKLQRVLTYFTREIEDIYIRENFQRVRDYLRNDPVSRTQFTFLTHTFDTASTYSATLDIAHGAGFQPKDIILLSITDDDAATITWNYDDFTETTLNVTVSAACTIRAFVGRYGD